VPGRGGLRGGRRKRCGPLSAADDEIIRRVAAVLERRPDCVARLVDVALLARWLRQEGATIEAIPDARLAVDQHWVDAVLLQQTHPLVRRLIHRVVARSDYLLPEC
jgi:hypothetical protein